MAAMVDLVERRVSDRKAADSRFDIRSGNASLCSWEDNLRLFSHWHQACRITWKQNSKKGV